MKKYLFLFVLLFSSFLNAKIICVDSQGMIACSNDDVKVFIDSDNKKITQIERLLNEIWDKKSDYLRDFNGDLIRYEPLLQLRKYVDLSYTHAPFLCTYTDSYNAYGCIQRKGRKTVKIFIPKSKGLDENKCFNLINEVYSLNTEELVKFDASFLDYERLEQLKKHLKSSYSHTPFLCTKDEKELGAIWCVQKLEPRKSIKILIVDETSKATPEQVFELVNKLYANDEKREKLLAFEGRRVDIKKLREI